MSNNSSFGQATNGFDHFAGTRELYKILFALFDSVGISGNLIVIFTILLNRSMHSSVYFLLCNLAMSDLLFAILVSFHIKMLTENYNWQFGATFCKIYFFSYRLFYCVSMLNLIMITVQRYRATRHPFAFRIKASRTSTLIITSWVLAAIISSPFLFVMKHINHSAENYRCFQQWPSRETQRAYYTCILTILYTLPFLVMAVLYGIMFVILRRPQVGTINETQQRQLRKRKKLSLIIGVIVLMFFTCWTPWIVLEFIRVMDLLFGDRTRLATAFNYSLLGVVLNTAVNPILLNFMSSEFRNGFKGLFRPCSCQNLGTAVANTAGSAVTVGNPEIELARSSPSVQVSRIVVRNTSCS